MAVDGVMLAKRLREARENRGLTQEQAGRAIGVSRTALVHIESGERSLSTLEFSGLAELYERSVADFFIKGGLPATDEDADPLSLARRLAPGLFQDRASSRDLARCLRLCRLGVELEGMLGLGGVASLPIYEFPAPRNPLEAARQGEAAAEDERRRLGLGRAPAADLADLICGQGVWAAAVAGFPVNLSSLFLRHPLLRLAVFVNADQPPAQRRPALAHGYAHALIDRGAVGGVASRLENRGDLLEQRAAAFAAAFLTPREGVQSFLDQIEKGATRRRSLVNARSGRVETTRAAAQTATGSRLITYPDVVALAAHFGVGFDAGLTRLGELGCIGTSEMERLLEKSDAAGRMSRALNGPGDVDGDRSGRPDHEIATRVVRLVVEAYRRQQVSGGWIRDLSQPLQMSADDLLELAVAAED